MAIEQFPFTSGSHWRIPTPGRRAMSVWLGRLGQRKKTIVSAALVLVTLGGVSIAPLAALAALVMLFASESGGARSLAAPLIIGAAIWLVLAVLCAHACHTGSPSGPCDPDDAADA